MPYPYAAVLFDMDGVVVDNMPLHRQVWTDFARDRGVALEEARLRALDGRRALDIIAQLFGHDLDAETVTRLSHERESLYRDRLAAVPIAEVPGIRAYLERLGALGVPRVLATSATPGNMAIVLERLGLQAHFEATVNASGVTRGKPDPEVYLTAAGLAGVEPARCLVVEDALPGVAAAKAAGATCLGLMTSEPEARLRAAGADLVAPDFQLLPGGL